MYGGTATQVEYALVRLGGAVDGWLGRLTRPRGGLPTERTAGAAGHATGVPAPTPEHV